MAYHLGIDFGTAFTTAARWDVGRDRPELVEFNSAQGVHRAMPSLVLARDSLPNAIGWEALGQRRPGQHLFRSWKAELLYPTSQDLEVQSVDEQAHRSWVTLTSQVLAVAFQNATRGRGVPQSTTLTYPSGWETDQVDMLRSAAQQAQILAPQFCPAAKAIATFFAATERGWKTLAIFDMGAAYLDVSMIKRSKAGIEVRARSLQTLGGDQVDEFLLTHVGKKTGGFVPEYAHPGELRDLCRKKKHELSKVGRVFLNPNGQGPEIEVTKTEFNDLIKSPCLEVLMAAADALRQRDEEVTSAERVLLVGGSASIPLIGHLVEEVTNTQPIVRSGGDEVALGAAYLSRATTPVIISKDFGADRNDSTHDAKTRGGLHWLHILVILLVIFLLVGLVAINALFPRGREPEPRPSVTSVPSAGGPPPTSGTPLPYDLAIVPLGLGRDSELWVVRTGLAPASVRSYPLHTGLLGGLYNPALSRDRRMVVFIDAGTDSVYSTQSDDRGKVDRLFGKESLEGCRNIEHLSWSRVGDQPFAIVCLNDSETYDLLLVSYRGELIRRLVRGAPRLDDPSISPDGSLVAYWKSEDPASDGGEIWVAATDGSSDPVPLTFDSQAGNMHSNADPAWNPVDKRIAYRHRLTPTDSDIYSMSATGTDTRRLITGAGLDQKPTWSPDGEYLLYCSDRSARARKTKPYDLFVASRDGSGSRGLDCGRSGRTLQRGNPR